MTDAVLPGLALIRPRASVLLARLIALGLLAVVAVEGVRIDRRARDLYLTDGFDNVITDGFDHGITIGRAERWDLVVGITRLPLVEWTQAYGLKVVSDRLKAPG